MAEQSFLRQRKIATYTYMLFGFLLAVEYSAVLISQLFYLRQTVKIENPEIYYSLITTTMAIAAAGSGIFAGQYTDKTRNLKKVLLLFAVLSMVGNVLYTIHHSVWSLFISRFLFGLTDAVQPAILGSITYVKYTNVKIPFDYIHIHWVGGVFSTLFIHKKIFEKKYNSCYIFCFANFPYLMTYKSF